LAAGHRADAAMLPGSTAWRVDAAGAIVRGVATSTVPYWEKDAPRLWTATRIEVSETLKGNTADTLWFERRGGELPMRAQVFPDQPRISQGAELLVFVQRRADRRVTPLEGSLGVVVLDDLSEQARKALVAEIRALAADPGGDFSDAIVCPADLREKGVFIPGPTGVGSRFLACDRGEPIPCWIDTELLPTGVSTGAALTAVQMALDAWEAASTASFRIEGLANFGMSAADIVTNDAAVRIQLHDKYNEIGGPLTLGVGGRWASYDATLLPNGGLGARVGTNRFDRSDCGYVVIEHGKAAVQSVTGLAEVVCHELGHVLGLGHSSDDSEEEDEALREALMFALYHGDGRGAQLGLWDQAGILLVHPTNDTPPYSEWRAVDVLTSAPQWSGDPDLNRWEMRAYDRLGGGTPTWTLSNATANYGNVSHVTNGVVAYAPAVYGQGPRLDPAGTGYYDRCYVTVEDGTNASPPVLLRVIEITYDGAPRDRLPDPWQSTYGVNGADNDPDLDGFGNLSEWINGTLPNSASSKIVITGFDGGEALVFPARAYDLYQLWSSPTVDGDYARCGNAVRPTTGVGTARVDRATADRRFLRVERVQ
jgi:hypothetical protein